MNDTFITAIEVKKVRNVVDFHIPLSETERKHLLITGKNGSGKTSLLEEIDKFIQSTLDNGVFSEHNEEDLNSYRLELKHAQDVDEKRRLEKMIKEVKLGFAVYGGTIIHFNKVKELPLSYLTIFFEAKRHFDAIIPQGIKKLPFGVKEEKWSPFLDDVIVIPGDDFIDETQDIILRDFDDAVRFSSKRKRDDNKEKINQYFIQYIVNLKAERSFAKDDNDTEAVQRIDAWFERFGQQLQDLFDAPDLRLVFDRQHYNFNILIGDNEPFTFNQLSDGYSAAIGIVTELILRMEALGNIRYDQQGIVMVDEIETHLHVALQKKIMPFLCAFFPNIQFIVTTHSPFVLSSLSNAVVCDLETREVLTDLSGYSYQALVEAYFDTDKYSATLKEKVQRYETLAAKQPLNAEETSEYRALKRYFDSLPTFGAEGLAVKLQQIKLQELTRGQG